MSLLNLVSVDTHKKATGEMDFIIIRFAFHTTSSLQVVQLWVIKGKKVFFFGVLFYYHFASDRNILLRSELVEDEGRKNSGKPEMKSFCPGPKLTLKV